VEHAGNAGAAGAGTPHNHGDDNELVHPAQREAIRRSRNADTAGKRRRRESGTASATAAVIDHDAADVDPYLADPAYFQKTFNEDPRAALQFLHHCTGLSSFHDLFDLKFNAGVLASDDDVIERLNATIDEVRRATDTVVGARARVLDQYHAKRNREAPLLSCAACGIREFDVDDNGYQRFALSRLKTFTYQFPRDADLVARIERAAVLPLQAALLWTFGSAPASSSKRTTSTFSVTWSTAWCSAVLPSASRQLMPPLRTTIQEPTNASGVSFFCGVH
jgi:hypothetical protein